MGPLDLQNDPVLNKLKKPPVPLGKAAFDKAGELIENSPILGHYIRWQQDTAKMVEADYQRREQSGNLGDKLVNRYTDIAQFPNKVMATAMNALAEGAENLTGYDRRLLMSVAAVIGAGKMKVIPKDSKLFKFFNRTPPKTKVQPSLYSKGKTGAIDIKANAVDDVAGGLTTTKTAGLIPKDAKSLMIEIPNMNEIWGYDPKTNSYSMASVKDPNPLVRKQSIQEAVAEAGNPGAIPRPTFGPQRVEAETNLTGLDDAGYDAAWAKWPNKQKSKDPTQDGWNLFQEAYGTKHSSGLKRKPAGAVKGNTEYSSNMSVTLDKSAWLRKNREKVLTYWFGGTPANIDQLRYKNELGENIDPHHRTGSGELSAHTDYVLEKLLSPVGSKEHQEGLEMLEIGREILRNEDAYAGNVLENFEGYTHPQHKGGEGSIHDRLGPAFDKDTGEITGQNVTGSSGKSPFNFPKQSKGVKGQNTADFIKSLAWKREQVLDYRRNKIVGGQMKADYRTSGRGGPLLRRDESNFWNTLLDQVQLSQPGRDMARKDVLTNPTLQKPGATPGINWRKEALEARKVNKKKVIEERMKKRLAEMHRAEEVEKKNWRNPVLNK